jgi:ketosteroid isomerase-like protein
VIAALLFCAVAATSPAAEIANLESIWNAAHLKGDADTLESLASDDIEIDVPGMRPMTKSNAFGVFRARHMRFDRYETSDTNIRVYGDTAIVTGRLLRTRTNGGKTFDDDWRFTKVWTRRDGQWRVVSFHASPNSQ